VNKKQIIVAIILFAILIYQYKDLLHFHIGL